MNKILAFFNNHWLALILALSVGGTIIFPNLLFFYQAGDQYGGFNMFETDGEYYYLARVREVYDGHYSIASPLFSVKDLPYVYPPLPELIMGFTGLVLGLGINGVAILFRFLSPSLIFLLIYFLVLRLSGNKKAAIFAPIVTILAYNLISSPGQLWQILTGSDLTENQFSIYSRPVNPQISTLFFLAFLYAFWQRLATTKKRYFYYSVLLFGLAIHVYLYTWVFLTIFLGLQGLVSLIRRQAAEFKKVLGVLLIGSLFTVPYFLNSFNLSRHFSYPNLTLHYGLVTSHQPVFSSVVLLALVCLFFVYILNRPQPVSRSFWFLLLLVLSGAVAINQQIITGQLMQAGHFHWYFNRPILIIVIAVLLFQFLDKIKIKSVYQHLLLTIIVVISFVNIFEIHNASYQYHLAKYWRAQKYQDVIGWFNKNAQPEAVVYVPESYFYPIPGRDLETVDSFMLNRFMVIYTPLNVYYDSKAGLSLLPYPDYDKYNLLLTLKLLNIQPDQAADYLQTNPAIFRDISGMYFKTRGLNSSQVPADWISSITSQYQDFYLKPWPEIFSQYPLDYIAWDKADLPDLPFEQIKDEFNLYQEVYSDGQVIVYEVL